MKLIKNLLLMLLISNLIIASCGKCGVGSSQSIPGLPTVQKTSINTLVTTLPEDGNIEGIVITSCGTCKLGVKGGGCSLSVKIGDTIYPVQGTGIHDHGDAHASDGFCSAVRVAWAKGQVKDNVFHSESFVLVGSSE